MVWIWARRLLMSFSKAGNKSIGLYSLTVRLRNPCLGVLLRWHQYDPPTLSTSCPKMATGQPPSDVSARACLTPGRANLRFKAMVRDRALSFGSSLIQD